MPTICFVVPFVPGLVLTMMSSVTWFADTPMNGCLHSITEATGFTRTLGLETYVIPFSKQNTGGQDSPPFNVTASGYRTFFQKDTGGGKFLFISPGGFSM